MPDIQSQPSGLEFHEIPQWCVDNHRKFSSQAGRIDRGIQDAASDLAERYEENEINADVYASDAEHARQRLDEFAVKSVQELPAYASVDKEPEEYQAMADAASDYIKSGYAADVKELYQKVYDVSQVRTPAELCDRDVRDNSVKQPFYVSETARRMLDGLAVGVKDPDTGRALENYSKFEDSQFDKKLDEIAKRHTGKSVQEIHAGFDVTRAAVKSAEAPVREAEAGVQRSYSQPLIDTSHRRTQLSGMPVTGNQGPEDPYGFDEKN